MKFRVITICIGMFLIVFGCTAIASQITETTALFTNRTNLVVNGGFEQPTISRNSYRIFTSIPGWTSQISGIEVHNFPDNPQIGLSYEGAQHVELDTTRSSNMYQDIPTVIDAYYLLSFAYSARPRIKSNEIDVFWGSSKIDTLSADGTTSPGTSWKIMTYTLKATSNNTRLGFWDVGVSDSLGGYLDAVSIEQIPVHITSPTGKDMVLSGQDYEITWSTIVSNEIENVTLEYSIDNKVTWDVIEASIVNNGSYAWAVPDGVASDQCNIRISDAADPNEYRISDTFIIYTTNLRRSLQLNRQEIGQINGDIGFELWSFSALVGQQVRLQNLNSSGSVISYNLIGPDGWEGFIELSDESGLVTLPESGNYTLIARSTAVGEDIVYSFVLSETTQTELPFDVIYEGSFAGSDQAELFHITVDDLHSMHIKLDDAASDNYNELYLKYGLPPTRGDYDYRYSNLASPDQDILLLSANTGDWYLLIYGDTINTPSNYTLIAEKKPIILTDISPEIHGDIIDTVFTLNGAGFEHIAGVNLVADVNSYPADSIEIVGDGRAYATFVAQSVPAGIYSVEVVHDEGQTDRLDDVFEMVEGGLPKLETNLILPSRLGYHSLATIYVEYSNTGYASMPAPVLVVNATQKGREAALLTLDKSILGSGFWTSTMPEGFDTSVQFLASGDTPGVLHPGETKRVPIYYTGWLKPWNFSYPPIKFELSILDTDNNEEIDWNEFETEALPPDFDPYEWKATFAKVKQLVGNTWGQYCQLIIDQAIKSEQNGEVTYDVSKLFSKILNDAYTLAMFDGRTIVGQVFLEDSGEPVNGAEVFVFDQEGGHISSTVTDSQGWYVLGTLSPGVHQLEVEDYFLETDIMVNIDGSQQLYAVDLPVIAGAKIAGIVLDAASGQPIQDAEILISIGEEIFGFGTTNEFGKYVLPELVAGTYNLNSRAQGYATKAINSVVLSLGEEMLDFDISLEPGAVLSGRVFEDASTPIPNTELIINGSQTGHFDVFLTDSSGAYEFVDLPADVYTLTVLSDSHVPYETSGLNMSTGAVVGYDVFMDIGGAIKGTVYHAGTTIPISGVEIIGIGDTGQFRLTQTDQSGNYFMQGLSPGTWDVQVKHSTFQDDHLDNIVVVDQQIILRDFELYSGASASGKVIDSSGMPLANAVVKLISENTDGFPTVEFTDTNGLYALSGVSPGTYKVTVELSGYETGEMQIPMMGEGDVLTGINFQLSSMLMQTEASEMNEVASEEINGLTTKSIDAMKIMSASSDLTQILQRAQIALSWERELPPNLPLKRPKQLVCQELSDDAFELQNMWVDLTSKIQSINEKGEFLVDSQNKLAARLARYHTNLKWEFTWENVKYSLDIATNWSFGSYTDAILNHGEEAAEQILAQVIFDAAKLAAPGVGHALLLGRSVEAAGNVFIDFRKNIQLMDNGLSYVIIQGEKAYDKSVKQINNEVKEYDFKRIWFDRENEKCLDDLKPKPQDDFYQTNADVPINIDLNLLLRNDLPEPSRLKVINIDPKSALGATIGRIGGSYLYYPNTSSTLANLRKGEYLTDQFEYEVKDQEYGETAKGHVLVNVYGVVVECPAPAPANVVVGSNGLVQFEHIDRKVFRDSDCDGTPDWEECPGDDDCDGTPDEEDDDYHDTDGDGVPDYRDYCPDTPGNETASWNGCSGSQQHSCDPPFQGPCNEGEVRTDCGCVPDEEECDPPFVGPCNIGEVRTDCGCKPADEDCDPPFVGPCNVGEVLTPCGCEPEPCTDCGGGGTPDPNTPDGGGGSTGAAGSMDPNKKTGPAGGGAKGFIKPGLLMPYKVEFENDPNATAPAQIVTVTDQLDSHLDWTTFELTEIAFGDHIIPVPANTQHFEWTEPMHYNGLDFEVQIEVGIHLATGEVYADFYSIDPAFGLPPGVDHGFLPPEDGSGRGMGHFSYIIRQVPDLPTRTEIRNIAYITFDFAETIATNQVDPHDPSKGTDSNLECLNTIDAGEPSSYILPLPAESALPFNLQCVGQDGPDESGIARYDIYVSVDGGLFNLLLSTPNDYAIVDEFGGSTCSFYSVAVDNAGNYEDPPDEPDAITVVVSGNESPIADSGPDQEVERISTAGADVSLDGSGSSDPDGDSLTYEWTWDGGGSAVGVSPTITLPMGLTTVTLIVSDGQLSDSNTVDITVVDTTAPEVIVVTPVAGIAVQDGVTLEALVTDLSVVTGASFTIRERDGADGTPVGFENLAATYNGATNKWEYAFDSTQFPDGYYQIFAAAVDEYDNAGVSEVVNFSIRNWAVVELLPSSETYRAGRTMPIKFSLRISAAVDPAMPFVYNEELKIDIYKGNETDPSQSAIFGETSTNYRINSDTEHYITNYKTAKQPSEYTVKIWRIVNNFFVEEFTFETARK